MTDQLAAQERTSVHSAELTDLRRRAYGPDADIGADPVAQARLAELEEAARPAIAAEPASRVAPLGAPQPPELETGDASDVRRSPRAPHRLRGWLRRHRLLLSVAGSLIVIALAALWTTTTLTADHPDATLSVVVDSGSPQERVQAADIIVQLRNFGIEGDGIERHEAFETLVPWTLRDARGNECLAITEGEYGVLGVNCTPSGLNPIVDIAGGLTIPREYLDLPEGSAYRFLARDHEVLAWERVADVTP